MERKYSDDLTKWKDRPNRKPLLIWGARQIGKTYLVKNLFAERYYKGKYIYVDCHRDTKFTKFCSSDPNDDDIIRYLSIERGMKIDGSTLLIFDEAQECPHIITMMKYFCQNHREIPVVVTGSMVRMRIRRLVNTREKGRKNFLFPVGNIDQITMHQLTFDEYAMNRNQKLYEILKEAYEKKEPLEKTIHEMAMDMFYEYALIGGMPEPVDAFLKTGNTLESLRILKDIYDNYLLDMELYQASQESILRSRKIFSNIYSQLNTETKNFKSGKIGKGLKSQNLIHPLDWLTETHTIQIIKQKNGHVTAPLTEDAGAPYRIYLCDMGMFSYQSGINGTSFISDDGRNMLSGIFHENYVSIELASRGINAMYWKGKNNAEFEFIVELNSEIIPIDVKKKKGTMNSVEKFKDHNKYDFSIKVSSNNYGYDTEKRILTVPFYEFCFLADDLSAGRRPVRNCKETQRN